MSHEDWPEDRNFWKLGIDDMIDFGKYEGKTVKYVLDNDPKYLKWMKDKGIRTFKSELNQELKERL